MWLLFVLLKVFPPLFVSFLNSLPVIACTTLLLGVLLIHSEPNTRKHGRRRCRRHRPTEEGSEANSLAGRVVSAATRSEQVSEQKKDADSDEWHEIDREQDDDDPSDFMSVDDEDENKAVSWSEDDRSILDRIGNSELERNRRLERVIAIRKTRRVTMDDDGGDEPILHEHPSMLCPIDLPHDRTISEEESESDSSETDEKLDATGADRSRWFARSLASVDEHESLSREVSVIEEADVIGDEACRARRGFGFRRPTVRAAPAPVAKKKTLLRSSVVSMRMKD